MIDIDVLIKNLEKLKKQITYFLKNQENRPKMCYISTKNEKAKQLKKQMPHIGSNHKHSSTH